MARKNGRDRGVTFKDGVGGPGCTCTGENAGIAATIRRKPKRCTDG